MDDMKQRAGAEGLMEILNRTNMMYEQEHLTAPDGKTNFAVLLRTKMQVDEISAAYIAKQTGLTLSAIYKYMSGERTPSLPVAVKIAQCVRMDLNAVKLSNELNLLSLTEPLTDKRGIMIEQLIAFIRNDGNKAPGIEVTLSRKIQSFIDIFRRTARGVFYATTLTSVDRWEIAFRKYFDNLLNTLDAVPEFWDLCRSEIGIIRNRANLEIQTIKDARNPFLEIMNGKKE